MWIRRVQRGLLVACVIGWVALIGLVLVAGGIGQARFSDSPVLTFVTYANGGQAGYQLGVLDVRANRLLRRPQPSPALVLAQETGGALAIVGASYKPPQVILTVYDASGIGPRLLTTGAGSGSSWSPDGRYYAFELRSRRWSLVLIDTATGVRTTIAGGLGNDRLPVWWP